MRAENAAGVTAVILAAGASSRMRGRVKALLRLKPPWSDTPQELVIERIGRLLQGAAVARIVVVLGHHRKAIAEAAGSFAVLAVNPDPDRGMFSSVQVGLEVAMGVSRPPAGILVWPVDVPLVSSLSLDLLLDCGILEDPDAEQLALPALRSDPERTGHPILLSRATARRLRGASADSRLDHALREARPTITRVLVKDRFVMVDLDCPEVAADHAFLDEG